MSCGARQASSLQSMLNFFMGLLRKRGETNLSSFALEGTCPPAPLRASLLSYTARSMVRVGFLTYAVFCIS